MVRKTAKLGVSTKPAKKSAVVKAVSKTTKVTIKKTPREKTSLPISIKTKKVSLLKVIGFEKKGKIAIHDKTGTSLPTTSIKKAREITTPLPKPALLSPFRFPLVPEVKTRALIARSFGLVFVGVGVILSLIQFNSIDTQIAFYKNTNSAALLQSNTKTTPTESGANLTTGIPAAVAVKAQISVETLSNILSETVPVAITVPDAASVNILVKNSDNVITPLGYAERVDSSVWRYKWNTSGLPDGKYKLLVAIQTTTGVQSQTYGDGIYELKNSHTSASEEATNPDPTTQNEDVKGDESPDTGDTESITTQLAKVPVTTAFVSIVDIDQTVQGNYIIEASAQEASEVRFRAKNLETSSIYYIGLAKLVESTWTYTWDTTQVPDGTYSVYAKATIQGKVYEDSSNKTFVKNTESVDETDMSTTESVATTPEVALTPTINLQFSKTSPVSNYLAVSIKTSTPVQWVEVYAKRKSSLTQFFLGLAQKKSDTEWEYLWQTTQSPNGDYSVFSRVQTSYGYVEGETESITIKNEPVQEFTQKQESVLDTLQEVKTSLVAPTQNTEENQEMKTVYVEPVATFVETIDTSDEERTYIDSVLVSYTDSLREKLGVLGQAKRNDDNALFDETVRSIEELKSEAITTALANVDNKDMVTKVTTYLSQVSYQLQEITLQNEMILKERIGDAILLDSDKDEISDYDEIHLYKTNPFTADTDNDGYIDSAEIKNGFDPHDSNSEAFVEYESPKEVGIVREDLFVIESISTLIATTSNKQPRAIVEGRGLPNSFVTLYIFSTPIVVTVKTDENGDWSYVLDKELDNGDHEVYVGITDNAGKIVAKSNPLPFVKTAEAFTSGTTEKATQESIAVIEPSLLHSKLITLIASLGVVLLGLILIFLGYHVSPSPVIKNELATS